MPEFCNPCSQDCIQSAFYHEQNFRELVSKVLCKLLNESQPLVAANARRINGTYTGTNQVVIAAPGVGKKIVVRSLYAQTEDTNTDVRFGSADTAVAPIGPNMDFLSNAGAVLPVNSDGWFETLENQALVVTTTGGAVDLLGTAVIVPV